MNSQCVRGTRHLHCLPLAFAAKRRLRGKGDPLEKRRLLNFVVSNSTWSDDELSVTFRQPFDLLAQTTTIVAGGDGGSGLNSPRHPGWLGD
jgi:site-specific DNA recombinase